MVRAVQYAKHFAGAVSLALALTACGQSDRPTLFDPPPPPSSSVETPARGPVEPVSPGHVIDVADKATRAGIRGAD